MTAPPNDNARVAAGVEVEQVTALRKQFTTPSPSCGKYAAVLLYCYSILPLRHGADMFGRNHQWWHA